MTPVDKKWLAHCLSAVFFRPYSSNDFWYDKELDMILGPDGAELSVEKAVYLLDSKIENTKKAEAVWEEIKDRVFQK